MAQTYCGKDCTACEYRESTGCYGCKAGPGRLIYGDCEIAKCCRAKGHQDCSTCVQKDYCGQLKCRIRMPEYRRQKQETEAAIRAEHIRTAPFFGKWLGVLFWLLIVKLIVSNVGNAVVTFLPDLNLPFVIANLAVSIVYAIFLFILSKEDQRHYKLAGIFVILAAVATVAVELVENEIILLLIAIPTAVLSITAEHHQYWGHIENLQGVSDVMAQSWQDLWKWRWICIALVAGGISLSSLFPIFPLIAVIVGLFGTIYVGVYEFIYLRRSANAFREYALEGAAE